MLNCLLPDSSCFIFVKQHFLPVSCARWSMRHLLYNNIEVFFMFLKTKFLLVLYSIVSFFTIQPSEEQF